MRILPKYLVGIRQFPEAPTSPTYTVQSDENMDLIAFIYSSYRHISTNSFTVNIHWPSIHKQPEHIIKL
jgi:hypothetical protein